MIFSGKRRWLLMSAMIPLLSLPVILGWHTRQDALGRLFSAWSQMQLNAALGIFALGIGTAAARLQWTRTARIAGILSALLGALTLSQYVFEVNLGIDELFRRAHNSTYSGFPGRMAPNTAIGFILIGTALVLLNRKNRFSSRSSRMPFIAGLLSSLPIAFGAVTLAFRSMAVGDSYGWGNYALTSPPSSAGLFLAGLLTLSAVIQDLRDVHGESSQAIPLYLSVTLFTLSITLWQFFLWQDASKLERIVELQAQSMKTELESRVSQYSRALKRMATRIEYLGTTDKPFLALDSRSYISHLTGIRRIGLVNTNHKVTWSYPPEISRPILGFDQSLDPERKSAFDFAFSSGQTVLSRRIELRSGGAGFLMPTPLFARNSFLGFIYATIEAQTFFDHALGGSRHRITIRENGERIYSNGVDVDENESRWRRTADIHWGTTNWEIELAPTLEFLRKNESTTHVAVLLTGIFISILISLLLRSLLVSEDQRLKHVTELRTTTKRLKMLIDSSPVGILVIDKEMRLTLWNPACERIFGWSESEALGRFPPFISHDRIEESRALIKKIHQSKEPFYTQGDRLRKNGASITAEIIAMPLFDEQGESNGLIAILADVTEKHQLQQKLLKANQELKFAIGAALKEQEKAIDASKLKSEFLANMNHEIRAPIDGVLGMANALLDSSLSAVQRDYADGIKRNAESITALINNALDSPKIEADKLPPKTPEKREAAVDWSVLDDLGKLDPSQGLVQELCDMFVSTTPQRIESLGAFLEAKEYESIKKEVHQLKSSGGNLGAKRFAQLCEELEHAEDWSSSERISERIREIDHEFSRVRDAMKSTISARAKSAA